MKIIYTNHEGEILLIGEFRELKPIFKSFRRNGWWVPFECPKSRYDFDVHIIHVNEKKGQISYSGRDAAAWIMHDILLRSNISEVYYDDEDV